MDLKHIGVLVSKLLDLKVIELVSSSCGHLPLLLAADHCTVKEERLLKIDDISDSESGNESESESEIRIGL